MQKKFGTVLNEKLLSRARVYCQRSHTTISHLFEEALDEYLQKQKHSVSSFSTVEASFGALKVSPRDLQSVLDEDIYET